MSRPPSAATVLALAPTLLLTGCLLRDPFTDSFPDPPAPETLPALPSGPGLEVLVLGDWGTGGEGQRALAESIAETHGESPPDFVMTVGDNFYPDGVTGPDDPIWETHFESVYRGPFWDSLVFHATLGNHDYHQNPQGEVEYSRCSPRWEMPDLHYVFRRQMPSGGSVLFLTLDTTPISTEDRTSSAQREWADSIMRTAFAEWVVVMGHHPVATGGWHEPDPRIQNAIWPILESGADLYLSGHNHSTELLNTHARTIQAVCGGGGGLDNPYRVGHVEGTINAFTNGGWCYLRLWPGTLVVDLYDREGGIQFRHKIEK
jgi:acid phosphatase